jgi:hypothetical protein
VYEREEFQKELLGTTLDEVRRKLGTPDHSNAFAPEMFNDGCWLSTERTKKRDANVPDPVVWILHKKDRVSELDFRN